MGDNALNSSFMMLTDHLYNIFVQYIIDGRIRAPPETELMDMLPTFQFGAKTDRRALQSKFKSWAKRMNFENGYLTLSNTGKIIIPKENCEGLIMYLHSEEHCSVEKIISQIQETYSWSKKNFGMDRDVVVECIFRNCKMNDCHKKIRLETAKISGSFCSSFPDSHLLQPQIPSPKQCISPYNYRWPFPAPVGPIFTPNNFPLQFSILNGIYRMGNLVSSAGGYDQKMAISLPDRKYPLHSTDGGHAGRIEFSNTMDISSCHIKSEEQPTMRFKKPKNVHEYKALIEAARLEPKKYPNILKSKKTQFLSNLGLAPKSICSSRTMKRFRQELRKKKLMNAGSGIYRERKILRDRNKLKRTSREKKTHIYLEIPKRKDSVSTRLEQFALYKKRKESRYLKFSKKIRLESGKTINRNSAKINQAFKQKQIEVIDIATSGDEIPEDDLHLQNNNTEDNDAEIGVTQNHPNGIQDEKQSVTITENFLLTKDKNTQNNIPKNEFVEKVGLPFADTSQLKPCFDKTNPEEIYRRHLNVQRVLLPTMVNHDNPTSEIMSPNVPLQMKRLPSPNKVFQTYAGQRNLSSKSQNIFLFPGMNPMPISIRPKVPAPAQPRSNFAVPSQNISPRVVYPIHFPKSNNSKVVFIDKEKGAFVVIPHYPRPILPRNLPKTETPEISNAKEQVVADLSLTTYQLPPEKAMSTEGTTAKQQKGTTAKVHGNNEKENMDLNEEMMRILNWIYRMKSNLNPCTLKHDVEKSVKKLISQLNVGIDLVRKAKKSLEDMENSAENQKENRK